ncbi:UDP-N-acetylmuramoyl-tripeptide--D-alanyl-D-alanine ligase [Cycloclasticus sp. 46_120_T64]|nr:UDP-N-acetylmuramoyl-tripeptide--D-alanyl-D-alanine ligase [Cycloclasticus sp. 46_120_T64]
MNTMNLRVLADIVGGELKGADLSVSVISSDTRSIQSGDLFVALPGENFNANDFAKQAAAKGAVAALLSADRELDIPYVKVANTLDALTALAADQRAKANIPLVGITGSNGKTSVKELLASILAQSKKVLATAGNLNNQIGVPLTLLKLKPEHEVAVIEMGASQSGDIKHLCAIAKPTVAILNNVAAAHLAGFGSLDGVAQAKAEIISGLSSDGTAILNKEEPWFEQWLKLLAERQVLSFGCSSEADVWADFDSMETGLSDGRFVTTFTLNYQQQAVLIRLRLIGQHNVMNALAAAAAAISLGLSLQQIQRGLEALNAVNGRMQVLKGIGGSVLVNDCYNANPRSFEAAMDCMTHIDKPLWLVLGDFAELGADSEQIHRKIGVDIANSGVRRFFAVGEEMLVAVNAFNQQLSSSSRRAQHFMNKQQMADVLQQELGSEVLVLVKGSRSQGLETVVEKLTYAEGAICC